VALCPALVAVRGRSQVLWTQGLVRTIDVRQGWGSAMDKGEATLLGAGGPGAVPPLRDGTRERILDAALDVLREVGHGQFSVQKVARAAGVYQGNITYYWPRRRDLVLALATRVVDDYRRTFLARLGAQDGPPAERAMELIGVMVADAISPERVRVLPELWSMANADPEIARAVIRCYDDVTDALLDFLGAGAGRPCSDDVRRAVHLAGVAVQGLTAAHGHRAVTDPVLVSVTEAVIALHGPLLAQAVMRCED
jgi:AcrR family transcriptional regulator